MKAIDDVLGPLATHPEEKSILRHNLALAIACMNIMRQEPFTERRNVIRLETSLAVMGVSFEGTDGELYGPGTIEERKLHDNQ